MTVCICPGFGRHPCECSAGDDAHEEREAFLDEKCPDPDCGVSRRWHEDEEFCTLTYGDASQPVPVDDVQPEKGI